MPRVIECVPEDSWFRKWVDLWPTTESPRSYILFAGMSMLSSVLGRKVWMDCDVHVVWPMLNLLLIGPSGIGKSTALRDIAKHALIEDTPLMPEERPKVISGKITKEALHLDLIEKPHALILASELANMFSKEKYMEGMIPYMTDLLDCEEVTVRTRMGTNGTIEKPEVTVVGGSTVEWLQEQLPSTATSGGFLARFLIVKEEHKFQRVPDPQSMLTRAQWETLWAKRVRALEEFAGLVRLHAGAIKFKDSTASDTYAVWYNTYNPPTGTLAPFAARAGEFVRRLSMLLAISRGHSTVDVKDVNCATELHKYCIDRLQEVIVPFTPIGKLIHAVLAVVAPGRTVSDVQIKRALRNSATAQEVGKIIDSLVESKDLRRLGDGKYVRAKGE